MLAPMLYRFGPFELDLARYELRARGEARSIEPQVFALLALLVENRERMVSKDEIVEKVWDGRIVSESAISSRIKSARQALGDDGRSQRFIKTIHGRGFRFVADVSLVRSGAAILGSGDDGGRTEEPTSAANPNGPTDIGRPSIAVLPFRLIGDAGPHAMIAEALPHDVIAELACLRWLFVTAHASSFRLRAAETNPGEAARILGVRYVLGGTLSLDDGRIVVTVELVDGRDGGVVWAARHSAAAGDIHAVRAEIAARVLTALEIRIPAHEATRAGGSPSESLDAWSAYHLGLRHVFRFNRGDTGRAEALFTRAIALDPDFARAHAGLSFVHFQNAFLRQTPDVARARQLARRSAERGLELDPLDPFVHFHMGRSFWLEGDLDGSRPWLDRAIALCPNYAQGIYARGWTDSLSGDPQEARSRVDLAMRLSPLDPLHYAMQGTRAFAHLALHEDEEAARWADRAARSPGAHVLIALIAVAAEGLAGREDEARRWTENVRSRSARLGREDFFAAFPMQSGALRDRIAASLARFGF